MGTRVDAAVLWSRALLVGSFAFFLGVAGHLMADGLLPGTPFLVVLFALTVLLSLPVLARRASPLRLVTLLVGGQTVIHLCLTLTAGHRGDPRPVASAVHPHATNLLPTVGGRRVGSLADAYAGTNDLTPTTPTLPIHHLLADMQAHAPMMVAHLAAAALVGLWLAHGERLLWALLALTGGRLLALARAPGLVEPRPRPAYRTVSERAPAGPRSRWLVRPHARRGPPYLLAATAR